MYFLYYNITSLFLDNCFCDYDNYSKKYYGACSDSPRINWLNVWSLFPTHYGQEFFGQDDIDYFESAVDYKPEFL